ncbi:MAG: transposase [Syntrophothermus sp.]
MILNDLGKIVEQQWYWLGKQYSYLILHEFIIMPDHLHVILEIRAKNHHQKIKPLPEIMGAFKMTASKLIHLAGYPEFKWHRSYHAIIIRDTSALPRIAQYIRDNPKKWKY